MEFCPKCGAILILKTKNYGCPRCDYSTKTKVKLKTSEKTDGKKEIVVISEKDNQTYPVIHEECRECGNTKAYFWTVQTRASDEAETKFFKCTKCGKTKRSYS